MPSAPIIPLVNTPVSATPTLLWKYNTNAVEEGYGASSPVVVNGVVYTSDENNYVYALNATDGNQLWNYLTGGDAASPTVADGLVYVNTDFTVNALNATNGVQIWSDMPLHDTPLEFSSPVVVGGVVYAGSSMGIIYAMNAKIGNVLWGASPTTNGTIANGAFRYLYLVTISSPAVANGIVYVTASNNCVYALNAKSGVQLWNYSINYSPDSSPTVIGGVVYVGSNTLNAKSGAKLANYAPIFEVSSSPTIVGGVIYIGSNDDNVYALNATSGIKIWNYTTGGPVNSSPAVLGGVVYVGSSDDKIYALNAANGDKLWNYTTSGEVGSPVVVNGVLYVDSGNNIYALRVSPATSPSSKPSNTLPIIIGVAVAVLIVVLVVFLIFLRKKGFRQELGVSKNGHS
jgi:outer membrane protein assembly factor BamB